MTVFSPIQVRPSTGGTIQQNLVMKLIASEVEIPDNLDIDLFGDRWQPQPFQITNTMNAVRGDVERQLVIGDSTQNPLEFSGFLASDFTRQQVEAGNDTQGVFEIAQNQNDGLSGGEGKDIRLGGDNILIFDLGNDNLIGGRGGDSQNGGFGLDTLMSGRDDDTLIGGGAFGEFGQNLGGDLLTDGLGDDLAHTSYGNDTLTGADPNSRNSGRGEIDTLTGGSADDLFILGDTDNVFYDDVVLSFGANDDGLITDFVNQVGEQDQIQLTRPEPGYFLGSVPQVSDRGIYLNRDVFGGIPPSIELIGAVQESSEGMLGFEN